MESKYCKDIEQLSRYAKALGHPARLSILQCLAEHNGCFFGDVHDSMPISKATVSQHLAELKTAGLITAVDMTPKVYYRIDKDNLQTARRMLECFFDDCEEKIKRKTHEAQQAPEELKRSV